MSSGEGATTSTQQHRGHHFKFGGNEADFVAFVKASLIFQHKALDNRDKQQLWGNCI